MSIGGKKLAFNTCLSFSFLAQKKSIYLGQKNYNTHFIWRRLFFLDGCLQKTFIFYGPCYYNNVQPISISGLFVNLYSAVERLLMYQDDTASETSVRYILFHELCPALSAIMRDGLKTEVITSFGRMKTNVWRVIEAVIRQGPSFGGGAATSDLVMLLNAKFPASGDDHRKFAGFVAGLLK